MQKTRIADLCIIGAGPTGLSAAVNATSEGLTTIILESDNAIGGQAKYSSRIENYLGFPNGVTGPQLMSRAYHQSVRFGAEFVRGVNAVNLSQQGRFRVVTLDNGEQIISNSVLLANGLQWRKLEQPGILEYQDKGIYYGLNMDMGNTFEGKNVFVIGGANSAGQAASFLSQFAASVTVVVRHRLTEMSEYLSERITNTDNITVLEGSELVSASGDGSWLTGVTLRSNGVELPAKADGVFIFIGAVPRTAWLDDSCAIDDKGFIITNDYQSSCEGVFAAGDIRKNSIKRIAAAVGEGSAAISHIHSYLANIKNGA